MKSPLRAYGHVGPTSPAWLVKRIGQRAYERFFAALQPPLSGWFLDIGCGAGEKRVVVPAGVRYLGTDLPAGIHGRSGVDAQCTAYALPFADASCDTVFCTGVLEHLEEPQRAVDEAHRVLKPAGLAVYAVPLFWHLHEEPRDFFRYTRYGIEHIFRRAGFAECRVEALAGFWVTAGSEFNYYLNGRRWRLLKPLLPAATALVNLAALLLNRGHRDDRWTWMYLVAARKRDAERT